MNKRPIFELNVRVWSCCAYFGDLQMLMSLDPSSPLDKPSLRTEDQTQTSVGLSAFNVDRLKKMREDMQVGHQYYSLIMSFHDVNLRI